MATASQVEGACADIERGVAAFRKDRGDVEAVGRAIARLAYLRAEFVADKATLEPYIGRLQEFSRQIAEELRQARQELVTAYFQAARAVADWEARKETLRNALIELARTDKLDGYAVPEGRIDVRSLRTLQLPRVDSPERETLTALLLGSTQAAAVLQPNHSRLLKALDAGGFTVEQAAEVQRLCRLQTALRLVAKPS